MGTKSGPQITVARKSGATALAKRLAGLSKLAAYVGVPSTSSAQRSEQLLSMAGQKASKRSARLRKAAKQDVNNAELLFIHTNGSPIKNIPARPVLQPAITAADNKQRIGKELGASVKAQLAGDRDAALRNMQRAALQGQNAARKWFTDPRNNWAPNAPATIEAKGSDRPLIDTGAMRASIVGIVKED